MKYTAVPQGVVVCVDFGVTDPDTGASTTPSAVSAAVYEDGTTVALLTPTPASRTTGVYYVTFRTSQANGFEVGKSYTVTVSATVGGNVIPGVVANFLIRPAVIQGAVLDQYAGVSSTVFGISAEAEDTPVTLLPSATAWWRCSRGVTFIPSLAPEVQDWDDSINGIPVSYPSNSPAIDTNGLMDFRGGTYEGLASAGYESVLAGGTAFTLGVRFRLDTTASTQTIAMLFDGTDYEYWLSVTTGTVSLSLNSVGIATSSTTLSTATWYNLIVVYDGSATGDANRLKLWINGVQDTLSFSLAVPASITARTSSQFFIGVNSGVSKNPMNGQLVQIFFAQQAADATTVAKLTDMMSGARTDKWVNSLLTFTTGALAGQLRKITDYNSDNERVTLESALTDTPDVGDAFVLVNQ